MLKNPPPPAADLNALAAEACDLWQAHLTAMATNPNARADLMQMTEPTRRLFADWAAMMQNGPHGKTAPFPTTPFTAPFWPTPAGPAPDAGAERVAELTRRVAELEERLASTQNTGAGNPRKP